MLVQGSLPRSAANIRMTMSALGDLSPRIRHSRPVRPLRVALVRKLGVVESTDAVDASLDRLPAVYRIIPTWNSNYRSSPRPAGCGSSCA